MRFFQGLNTQNHPSLGGRQVVHIEAEHDFFFSGAGSWDADFADRLERLGANVFRHSFAPCSAIHHRRSHHAIPLNHLRSRSDVRGVAFEMAPDESVADAIARCVFSRGAATRSRAAA